MTTIAFSTQQSSAINELFVFGDSLSDVGIVFRATGGIYPPNPPYFQGRYSNGRVWIEYLADRLQFSSQQTHNFAIGGATTGQIENSLVPGMLAQVQSFTQTESELNSNALYVLWAGANDYLQGVSTATLPVENITAAITVLAEAGAKKLLVANLPDLGHLPSTRSTSDSPNLSRLTQLHNQGLRRSLKLINQQYSDLQIATLDASNLYREAITRPATFGFINVTNACVIEMGSCSNPDQYLFWDSIHPTTSAHRILGETAFSILQDEGIINTQPMAS